MKNKKDSIFDQFIKDVFINGAKQIKKERINNVKHDKQR